MASGWSGGGGKIAAGLGLPGCRIYRQIDFPRMEALIVLIGAREASQVSP